MRTLIYLIFIILFLRVIHAQDELIHIQQIDSLGNIAKETFLSSTFDEPENVLVLYNLNYREDSNDNNVWDGYEIAEYYRNKRHIPDENIVAIHAPTSAEISRAEYDTYYDSDGNVGIKQQVEEILQTHKDLNGLQLRSKIKYIVLTKGIPYKISYLFSNQYFQADYSSVDAALALIFNGNYDIQWHYKNPYYNQDPQFSGTAPFVPEFFELPGSLRLSYLVTRLDGYTIEQVKSMIDKSVRADSTSRDNIFVLDGAQKSYDRMQNAADYLNSLGANVYPDPWVDSPENILSIQDSVIGIITHGTHAGLPASYITDLYNFKLGDGAVFSSYESVNGATFSENIQYGQGQLADFVKIGGSGAVGNVYEPYSSNIPDESVLLPAYYSGYTFAEAAYMSLRRIDWTAIVVGDPLMRIAPKLQPQTSESLRVISVKPDILAFSQSTNTVARIIFNEQLDTLNLPHFFVEQTGDTLNHFVSGQNLYLWPAKPLPNGQTITYVADVPAYSISGDSLQLVEYARFITTPVNAQPVAPYVYDAYPAGIDVDINSAFIFIFSTAMNPETIYPILSSPEIEQTHLWLNNSILKVSHPPLLQGTKYSFFLDEHAKSAENIGLIQNFHLNFETSYNSITYDIDNDGFPEYALNSNNSLLDGYENYQDNNGVLTSVYLTTDINNDNQKEYFIKLPQNNFPSFFWNPNAIPYTGYIDECVPVDDDEDGQTEYAFDFSGKGYFTHVYDPGDAKPVREIKFVLLKSLPADQQVNVAPSKTMKLVFSKPPKLNTINDNIMIEPVNLLTKTYTAKNGVEINVIFKENFPEASAITVTLKKEIISVDSEFLPHDYTISFQTTNQQTQEPPHITSFYPGDSLHIPDNTPTVRFVFSKPMKDNLSTPVITDTVNSLLWTHYWADSTILYLFPSEELEGDKNIEFTVSPDLEDKYGLKLTGKRNFNFTCNKIALDSNNPTILQVVPEPSNIINTNENIRIIFSEWITSSQQQWLSIQPQQSFIWSTIASNMYIFKGDPVWKPQSELMLKLKGSQILDANANSTNLDYLLNFYVLGNIIQRDIDGDEIQEYVVDKNNISSDGLETYVDPGGIITTALFTGDIDNDGFSDFLINDTTNNILLTWYPAVSDSGIIGYTEKVDKGVFEVSVDDDNLVEYEINTDLLTVQPVLPRVRSSEPTDGSNFVALFKPLILQFNTQMDAFSVLQSVHFSYPQQGIWTNADLSSKFLFEPEDGWLPGIVQTVSIVPRYRSQNGQDGMDSINIVFRTADEKEAEPGKISWQFPAQNDTVNPKSDYYFAFNQQVDTSETPEFSILQDFSSLPGITTWIADTLLKISAPEHLINGTAVLVGKGEIKFLNSPHLNFDRSTNYYIANDLSLKLIRPLFDIKTTHTVFSNFACLFNQPLDSAFSHYITFNKIAGNDTILSDYELWLSKNFITVKPENLTYSSIYLLKFSKELTGISGSKLSKDISYLIQTETEFIPSNRVIDWKQADNFLILTWPLASNASNNFELFLTEAIGEMPDTLSLNNRHSSTNNPSWLFDLQRFPQQAYVYIRMSHGSKTFWADPVFVMNKRYNTGNLASLPLTTNLDIDSLGKHQKYINTISQWSPDIPGWNSASYLEELKQWNVRTNFDTNKSIIARTKINGHLAWTQNLPEKLVYTETEQQTPTYQVFLNFYDNILADALADTLAHATRLAVWDNQGQGWNEAVFDSVNQVWINNFQLTYLQPVYALTKQSLVSEAQFPKTPYRDQESFPSQTKIFRNDIYNMQMYKDGIEIYSMIGCGVDTIFHTAYINTGNLNKHIAWLFKFYDNRNNLVDTYRYGILNDKSKLIPTSFYLAQPYPNPFNNIVTVPINIPGPGKIDITIYNILGQVVREDKLQISNAQVYKYHWKSIGASGIYYVYVKYNLKADIVKVVLIK